MLDLALKGPEQLPGLTEDGEVEVVVVVRDADLPWRGQPNSDGKVWDSLTSYLTKIVSLIVEDLNAVGPVVADKDLHWVVDDHPVGKLEKPWTTELVQNITDHVEDDDSHDLAFNDNDPTTVVGGHTTGMLEDVRTELADKLSILGENLNLYKTKLK